MVSPLMERRPSPGLPRLGLVSGQSGSGDHTLNLIMSEMKSQRANAAEAKLVRDQGIG